MIVRTRPNLLTLLFTLRGSILPRVAPKLAGIVAVSCAVVWGGGALARGLPDDGRRHALHAGRHRPVDLPELPQQRLLRALVGRPRRPGAASVEKSAVSPAPCRPCCRGAASRRGPAALRRLSAFAHGLHARLRGASARGGRALATGRHEVGPLARHRPGGCGAGRADRGSRRAYAGGASSPTCCSAVLEHKHRRPGGGPDRLRAHREHAAALRLHAARSTAPPGSTACCCRSGSRPRSAGRRRSRWRSSAYTFFGLDALGRRTGGALRHSSRTTCPSTPCCAPSTGIVPRRAGRADAGGAGAGRLLAAVGADRPFREWALRRAGHRCHTGVDRTAPTPLWRSALRQSGGGIPPPTGALRSAAAGWTGRLQDGPCTRTETDINISLCLSNASAYWDRSRSPRPWASCARPPRRRACGSWRCWSRASCRSPTSPTSSASRSRGSRAI